MPIIDVSQSSYRALVKAAHQRGMSIDRFIRHRIAPQSELPGVNASNVEVETAAGRPERTKASAEGQETVPGASVADSAFEALWGRIERSAGVQICTRRGQGFTYEVEAGYLTVCDSGARVPKSQFKKALAQWPATGPSTMRGIYAPSVVWAVLAALADRQVFDSAAWNPSGQTPSPTSGSLPA